MPSGPAEPLPADEERLQNKPRKNLVDTVWVCLHVLKIADALIVKSQDHICLLDAQLCKT